MNERQLMIKMALDSWQGQLKAVNGILEKLSDEQLMNEVSPTRNRGIYLLGHLTAVHDLMLPLLRFEEPIFPDLQPIFVDSPDKTVETLPPIAQLKTQWKEVNQRLLSHFDNLSDNEWFTRHANVSEEVFARELHRNRLNVVLGRTVHMSYHRAQLTLLIKKSS